jgi:phenylpropionate dioxygenase-like ring-hydroxylating dioxygenase large terminal subunit
MLKLENYWYIAAPSEELGTRPISRSVEGEVLVLFRERTGAARALVDRCAHRGMVLSRGRVVDDCIECPYHGWRYDGSGRVRAVPALCAGEPLPQPSTMRAYPTIERDDHVWVWIGSGAPTPEPFQFPRYGEPGWTTFFMQTRFEAPVEDCLENFLDVPHTIFTHPGLFRSNTQRPVRARVRRGDEGVEAEFLQEPELTGIGPRLVFPRGTVMKHTDRFILPSISRVDYAFGDEYRFIITSQCTQREEFLVDVTTAITWRLPAAGALLKPFLKTYCRRVIQQDVRVLNAVGGQLKRFGRSHVSTDADLLGRHILALRQRAAAGRGALREATQEVVLKI